MDQAFQKLGEFRGPRARARAERNELAEWNRKNRYIHTHIHTRERLRSRSPAAGT